MAFLPESEIYETGIFQIEEDTDVLGGPDGPDNYQGKQLANRTNYLKARVMPAVRFESIVPVIGAHAVSAADIGKVLSVHDPSSGSFTLPAIAGFPKNQPLTIVVTDDGTGNTVNVVANGSEIIENFLNSGDGVTTYVLRPGTRLVLVATVTSWVVVLKTEPQVFVAGFSPGDIKTTAAPIAVAQPGFLLCDGAAVSRSAYAALFTAIGTLYGDGDGSTTFNLPDHTDKFVRSHNNGGGFNDPGRVFGSYQADALKDHTHNFKMIQTAGSGTTVGYVHGLVESDNNTNTDGVNSPNNGGVETRSKNVTVNTYIKY